MVKVSIIIPAYNVEKYIQKSIESVLNQTEQDLEIILVNDGSTDRTLQIAEALAANDPRLHIVTQPNSGKPSVARNVGLAKAEGEYVCFLDGDDLYKADKLTKEIAVLEKYPEIDVVFHDMDVVSEEGEPQKLTYMEKAGFQKLAAPYLKKVKGNLFFTKNGFYNFISTCITGITTPTIMVRKSRLVQENTWFPEDLTIGEDIDLWFRLTKGQQVAFINESLCINVQHGKSITRNVIKMLQGSIDAHSRNYNRAKEVLSAKERVSYRKRIAFELCCLAYQKFASFEMAEARCAYKKSLKWFFRYSTLIGYLKTFIPSCVIRWFRAIQMIRKVKA